MKKIDIQTYAAGIGAVAGAYSMSSDNDLLAAAAGASIGGLVGLNGKFTLPNYDNMIQNNKGIALPNQAMSSLALQNAREEILSRANVILNSSVTNYSGAFDPTKPFSSLSKNNLKELSDIVYKTNDIVEIRRMSNALSQRADSVGLNSNSINMPVTQLSRSTRITENVSEIDREKAFKDHLRTSLGYVDDAEIHNKYLKFKPLLNKVGTHTLQEGTLQISGMEPIKLFSPLGTEGVYGHISNNNIYLSNDINPFGVAKLDRMTPKAVADALGIQVTNAFNLQGMLDSTEGLLPDDYIAMLSHSDKIGEDQLNKIIKNVNESNLKYDASLSGQYVLSRDNTSLQVNDFHKNIQGRTDFGATLNLDINSSNQVVLDIENPVRRLSTTSINGTVSEKTRLGRMIAQDSPVNMKEGVKPDYATEFANSRFNRSIINLESPANRNSAAAVRESVYKKVNPSTLDINFNSLVKDLNLNMQYGGALAIPRLSVPMELYNPIAARLLGAHTSIADGFSNANSKITSNIQLQEFRKVEILADAAGDYGIIENNTLKNILQGNIDLKAVQNTIEKYSNITESDISGYKKDFTLKVGDSPLEREIKLAFKNSSDSAAIEKFYIDRKRRATQFDIDLTFGADQTVGYTPEGLPVRTSKDLESFKLKSINMEEMSEGKPKIVMTLEGTSTLSNSPVSKIFGLDTKTQVTHLENQEFIKSGLVAELVNRGEIIDTGTGYQTIKGMRSYTNLENLFSKSVGTMLKDPLFQDKNYYRTLSRTLRDSVGIITDVSDSGQNVFREIKDSIVSGTNTTKMDDRLYDLLMKGYNTDNKNLTSLSKLGVTLTSSKASSSTILESLLSFKEQTRENIKSLKTSLFTNAYGNELNLVKANLSVLGIDTLDNVDVTDSKALATAINTVERRFNVSYATFSNNMVSYFNDPIKKLDTLATNPEEYFKFLPVLQPTKSENISLSIGTPSRRLEGVLGSATENKSMSQNAQLQLLYSGLDVEDLSVFGKHNPAKLTDLHSLIQMKNIASESVNEQLSQVPQQAFQRALSVQSDGRREALKNIGVDIKGAYGVYNLSTPMLGYKSIPIPLETSSIFGSTYIADTNSYRNPMGIRMIRDIIETDTLLANTNNATEQQVLTTKLQGQLEQFDSDVVKAHIFSSTNPLPKSATRLDSRRSMLNNVAPSAGNLDDFLEARKAQGLHQSFAEVSIGGAIERLRSAGFKVKDAQDLMTNYTETVNTGGIEVTRLKTKSANPFFSVINREPATGPGSTRVLEYILNTDFQENDMSLRLSWKDKLYKYLQFGDFDADHVAEFFPDSRNPKTQEVYNKLIPIAEKLTTMTTYGENLGVKGGEKSLTSLLDFLKGSQDYSGAIQDFFSEAQIGNEQAGLRKQVAPAATRLASALNNSLDLAGLSFEDAMPARVLSHYTVENLIKSAHSSTEKFRNKPTTDIEELEYKRTLFKQGRDSNNEYLKSLRGFLDSMLKPNASNQVQQMHQEAVDNVIKAETLYASKDILNTMELNQSRNKTGIEVLQDVQDVLAGNNSSASVLNTEDVATPVDARIKRGYNEILQTVKKNAMENKKLLALGGGALLATGLLTQENPALSSSARAEANPSAMMLRPVQDSIESNNTQITDAIQGLDLNRATDYILPDKRHKNSYVIDGQYQGKDAYRQAMRTSIFGSNNIDSARIETY